MFEIGEKNFELKYSIGRIELIEQQTEMPTLVQLQRTSGMLGLHELKIYFAYGLKEEGSNVFYPLKRGLEMCENLIAEKGYTYVVGLVLKSLERDCPFFFQNA